jgi:esterase/lipase superfamily enzyme
MPRPVEGQLYRNVIITTCKVEKDPNSSTEVTFTKSEIGDKAVFLMNIRKTDKEGTYKALLLSADKAAEIIRKFGPAAEHVHELDHKTKPLFCVHGFNVQPENVFSAMVDHVWDRFKEAGYNYFPVPVIWPCHDEFISKAYEEDQQHFATVAGDHLRYLTEEIKKAKKITSKSLLMHSMGNHVVFDGACGGDSAPAVQFENIFMIAADLPKDIFWENPWEYDDAWFNRPVYGNKRKKADNLYKMLEQDDEGKPKGKIYAIYNPSDRALLGSSVKNFEKRLGSVGSGEVRKEFQQYIESYNIYWHLKWFESDDFTLRHSYQFEKPTVEYYFSKQDLQN